MLHKLNSKIAATILALAFVLFTGASLSADDHEKAKKDIVTIAVEAGNFTILAKALTTAGLIETLQSEGPFTVFAPTDEAFAKLPEGTVEGLLKDKDALTNILLYHVVSGNVKSSDVVKLDKATTLSKSDVMIKVDGGNVMINDSQVTAVDIEASNGTIHVIDTVLLPQAK